MPMSAIIDSHSTMQHSFADDLQLQMSALPDKIYELLHSVQTCIGDVKSWAIANMPKLNDIKAELMLVTSKRHKHHNKHLWQCSNYLHTVCEEFRLYIRLGLLNNRNFENRF